METIRAVCPHCEAVRDIRVERRTEEIKVRKDRIPVDVEFCVCQACGGEFSTSTQMESNLAAARRVYRELHSIIRPEEIVALRERFDISQKAFAKLLDIGELTINAYEQGVLPSGAHNSLLRLAAEPANFQKLFEQHKEKLTERQREKIERALRSADGARQSDYDCLDERDDISMVAEAAMPYHGRPTREFGRLLDVIQLILFYARQSIHKMAVLKILFYIDFSSFRHTGCSITGWRYARLPYGPVPDDYKEILFEGEKCGRFTLEPDEAEIGDLVVLPDDFDSARIESDFTPTELQVIRETVSKLGHRSASTLRSYTHEELGWIETPHARMIPYSFAASLKHGV